MAYRQFIRDLAAALTNDTSMIDQDVKEIFAFEKTISKVRLSILCISTVSFKHFLLRSIIGHLMNRVLEIMKQFEQSCLIFLLH